ncbi:hypothetical protein ACSQ67_024643 [Phaseolus vulgaris]
MWRSTLNWLAVSKSSYPPSHFMANQGGLGLGLGRDASAAFSDNEQEEVDEDLDYIALENGYYEVQDHMVNTIHKM